MRIDVTGSSVKLGRVVVEELRAQDHQVVALDIVGERWSGFVRVDLKQFGDVVDVLSSVDEVHAGIDALAHLAAVPAPGLVPDSLTIRNNLMATFNVLQAARRAGVRRIVAASSEPVLGPPVDVPPPYLPVDEDYDARPESMYSLAKHLEEELASKLVRWDPKPASAHCGFPM